MAALGVAAILSTFPYISGEPGSVADSESPDPAWTRVVGGAGTALLLVGLLVLLAPTATRLLGRHRR